MRAAPLAACLTSLALGACAGSPSATAESHERIRQLEVIAQQGDESRIPSVIASLRSDDPLVRRQAQATLLKLTGTTNGFEWSAPRASRDQAIGSWIEWCRRHGLASPNEGSPHA